MLGCGRLLTAYRAARAIHAHCARLALLTGYWRYWASSRFSYVYIDTFYAPYRQYAAVTTFRSVFLLHAAALSRLTTSGQTRLMTIFVFISPLNVQPAQRLGQNATTRDHEHDNSPQLTLSSPHSSISSLTSSTCRSYATRFGPSLPRSLTQLLIDRVSFHLPAFKLECLLDVRHRCSSTTGHRLQYHRLAAMDDSNSASASTAPIPPVNGHQAHMTRLIAQILETRTACTNHGTHWEETSNVVIYADLDGFAASHTEWVFSTQLVGDERLPLYTKNGSLTHRSR
ncbi:hypothetical protein BOTBODRAFT_55040 [Botryobasidium botryosum FD-172 SS1]|uniref:Uncharacterized protein n=1 Tax=Botryobasidium botryosum (strain FD-172 SS1) TaxID=930990 RepID=A0A067MH54_BOTB1|nr:hypothetical protein BOTBODRAFT_55040 [Botryobasidium botryosum FD-172 SS1]